MSDNPYGTPVEVPRSVYERIERMTNAGIKLLNPSEAVDQARFVKDYETADWISNNVAKYIVGITGAGFVPEDTE